MDFPVVTPAFLRGLTYHHIRSSLAKGFPKPHLVPMVRELEDFRLLHTGRLYVQLYQDTLDVSFMYNVIRDCHDKVIVMHKMAMEGHPEADALLHLAALYTQEAANALMAIEELELGA